MPASDQFCGIAGVANSVKAEAGSETNMPASFMRDSESDGA